MFIACPRDCDRIIACKVCGKNLCVRQYQSTCQIQPHFQKMDDIYCCECWDEKNRNPLK
jgi:hypothetical protein